jgi:hypothetical protein
VKDKIPLQGTNKLTKYVEGLEVSKRCNVEGMKVRMKFLCDGLMRNSMQMG